MRASQHSGYAQEEAALPGKFFEDLQIGDRFAHATGRTVTEMDNVLFCALTLNTQPLHINSHLAEQSQFGQRLVNGVFTLGLIVGLSVADLTEGTLIANLGFDRVLHPNPVFHGDTLYAESEVIDKRESASKSDRGIVRLRQVGRKADGAVVIEFERTVMLMKRAAE
jgi:itaconyl-CoA hydratase